MVSKLGVKIVKDTKEALERRLSVPEAIHIPGNKTPDVESGAETKPLVSTTSEGVRKRQMPRYVPTDWDDSLPYGGKVYLARQKKRDPWWCIALQVFAVVGCFLLLYWAWFHGDHMHFHMTKLYAHYGHKEAQAIIGHKLLHGKGVEKNHTAAMEWFKMAADQGHPHAAYNLAVGYLQGIKTDLKPGEAKKLITHAAKNGVPEAVDVLHRVCSTGRCDI